MLDRTISQLDPTERKILAQVDHELETMTEGRKRLEVESLRDRLIADGLPSRRNEAWRYTDLRKHLAELMEVSADPNAKALNAARDWKDDFGAIACAATLTFVDGKFVPELSLNVENSPYIAIGPLDPLVDCEGKGDEIFALGEWSEDLLIGINGALSKNTLAIQLRNDQAKPVNIRLRHLVTVDKPQAVYHRYALWVWAGSQVDLIETFEGMEASEYLLNTTCRMVVQEGAKLRHSRVCREPTQAKHLGSLITSLEQGATYNFHPLGRTGAVNRLQVGVTLAGEESHFGLAGAAYLQGDQHSDFTLKVDHAVPNCTSEENYRLVLDDRAQGVFQGKIRVQQPAQKTEAELMGRALVLSEGAKFRGKPELEIYADDVVCGHGITSATLEEEQVYYLRSRGLNKAQAEELLVEAFVAEILQELPPGALKDLMEAWVREWAHESKAG